MQFAENKRHRFHKKKKDIRILGGILTVGLLVQGLTLLGLGIWVIANHRIPSCGFLVGYFTEGYITLAIGIILTLLNLLGLYIISRGSNFVQIRGFFGLLGILIAMEVTVAIMSAIHRNEIIGGTLLAKMKISTLSINTDKNTKDCWDTLQTTKHCCGVMNYSDWLMPLNITSKIQENVTILTLPKSCICTKQHDIKCKTVFESTRNLTIYNQGCYNVLFKEMALSLDILRILVPILAIAQLIHVVFTLVTSLHKQVPNDIHTGTTHNACVVYRVS